MKFSSTDLNAILVSLMLLYLGWLIFTLVASFRWRAIKEAAILLFAVFVGWSLHAWPGRHKGDDLTLVFAKVWFLTARNLAYATVKLLTPWAIDIWHALGKVI